MKTSIGLGFERTRALCVASMVIFHSLVWLSPYERWVSERHETYYVGVNLGFLLGIFALMLPACAGFSLRIFIRRHRERRAALRKVIALSAALLLAHAVMQYATWGKEALFAWEALPFLALAYALTAILFFTGGERAVMIFTVVAFLGTPTLRKLFSENSWWREILVGNQNPGGVWPLFPWYVLVGTGFIAAGRLEQIKNLKGSLLVGLVTVLSFMLVGNGTRELVTFSLWGSHPFQTSPLNVAALASGFVCLVLLMARGQPVPRTFDRNFALPLGRSVLPVYVLHVALGVLLAKEWQLSEPRLAVLIFAPFVLLAGSWSVGFLFQKLMSRRLIITFSRPATSYDH